MLGKKEEAVGYLGDKYRELEIMEEHLQQLKGNLA